LKHMVSFTTEHDLIAMFTSELFQLICEHSSNALFFSTLEAAVDSSQPLLTSIILQSVPIQRIFSVINLEYIPKLDMRIFSDTLDISDSIVLTKRLCMIFNLRHSTLSSDIVNTKLPIDETIKFITKTMERIPNEAMENYLGDRKQPLKGDSRIIKKEIPLPLYSAQSETLFKFLFILFKNLMKVLGNRIPIQILNFLVSNLKSDIKHSSIAELPSVYMHICMQNMALYTLKVMQSSKPNKEKEFNEKSKLLIETFEEIIFRDMEWMLSVTSSEITMHIVNGYVECKENRKKMLYYILRSGIKADKMIKYLIRSMAHNTTSLTTQLWKKLRMKYQYPIREEAAHMIALILQSRTIYDKCLADEIEKSNFIENERKITDLADNEPLVASSLRIFTSIINRKDIFSIHFIKQCQSMFEALTTRFYREWVDLPFLDVIQQTIKQNSRKNKNKNKGSSYKADEWRRPITTLNGNLSALVFAPGSRPTTVLR
jgi:hypothetical protein